MLERLEYSNSIKLMLMLQVLTLLVYLSLNIINVGSMGTALPLLIIFIGISVALFLFLCLKNKFVIRFHYFIFILFVLWIALRVVIDLGDMEYLKQITIGTTGGMILFYFIGALLGVSYHHILLGDSRASLSRGALIVYAFLMLWSLYCFSQRLHPSYFYLTEIDGSYQRSGNFLSISFLIISFMYVLIILKYIVNSNNFISRMFWLGVYTFCAVSAIMAAQLMGSNSATAVTLGVYLITLITTLIIPKRAMYLNFLRKKLVLPCSKTLLKQYLFMSIAGFFLVTVLFVIILYITDFDILTTRLLGFGLGTNTSLQSRIHILLESGVSQMGYAPIWGNINVAYLITGDAGLNLHSLFPFIFANLGIFGLSIVLLLFSIVFMRLYREIKNIRTYSIYSYFVSMIAIYSMMITVFIILFANLTVDVSWCVLWFTLGFISKPFEFKK